MSIDLRRIQVKELTTSDLWNFVRSTAQSPLSTAAVQDVFHLVVEELERRGENVCRCTVDRCQWTDSEVLA